MARSLKEIKAWICSEWMNSSVVAEKYGFAAGASFGDVFGAASIENMLMTVWSVGAYALERLMDLHKAEVSGLIAEMTPHRAKWYRDMVLRFMANRELVGDTGEYDTTEMTESEMAAARVVKHAVAVESRDAGLLTIKVAGEKDGVRVPLDAAHERGLKAYIAEIKDAGVRVALVNAGADTFNCEADVYYNPMLQPGMVRTRCEEAITGYIGDLPFNGEYTNMALVDALQGVEGVRVAELKWSTAQAQGEATPTRIDARTVPEAGYFVPGSITINMIAYDEQLG